MNKLIPLSLAAVFALTSGFTMAAETTATPAKAPTTQTKTVKKHHKHHKAHKATTEVAPKAATK